jgi:hypothetical protein
VRGHAQAVKDALAAWHASYDYYNFEETPAAASAVLPPASYHRLQKIKASYDPDQAIISAHPSGPSRSWHEHQTRSQQPGLRPRRRLGPHAAHGGPGQPGKEKALMRSVG